MGVTAFHIHWFSLDRDQIRSIHQIRGFMELKSASVVGRVTQECSNGGHLFRCAHTYTLTREPLTPIPSRLTLSLLIYYGAAPMRSLAGQGYHRQ